MRIREISAKSVLNKSGICDYCINCYTGCSFGCKYCYAPLIARKFSGTNEKWGSFVHAKTNAPEVLRRQLAGAKPGTIMMSSVCDPYQHAEKKYELTRKCLAELTAHKKKFKVSILTKSPLIMRDIDILKQLDAEAGMTIATDDDKIREIFEPHAPCIEERLGALMKLKESGIKTYAFIGPILAIDANNLACKLEGCIEYAFIDRLNYSASVRNVLDMNGMGFFAGEKYAREKSDEVSRELKKKGIKSKILF